MSSCAVQGHVIQDTTAVLNIQESGKNSTEFPYILYSASPVNILHNHHIMIKTKKFTLKHYYEINYRYHQLSIIVTFCSGIQPKILHCTGFHASLFCPV